MIISDLQTLGCITLDILYMFSIYDTLQKFTAAQPIKIDFVFDGVFPIDINGFALVLTNKLVSIIPDGQRHFDLI